MNLIEAVELFESRQKGLDRRSVAETASDLGLHRSTVSRWLRVAKKLAPDAKYILAETPWSGSLTVLLRLADLPPDDQVAKATQLNAGVAKTAGMARALLGDPQPRYTIARRAEILEYGLKAHHANEISAEAVTIILEMVLHPDRQRGDILRRGQGAAMKEAPRFYYRRLSKAQQRLLGSFVDPELVSWLEHQILNRFPN